MKKIWGISILASFLLFGCSPEATVSSTQSATPQSTVQADVVEEKIYKIGEEIFIKNSDGEYKMTITGVHETDERNQFAETSPAKVVIISYDYENISSSTDVSVESWNFKAYDADNNALDTYPVSSSFAQSVGQGRKASGEIAYGLDSDKNYIELEYYDNMFSSNSDCKITLEW